MKILFVPDVADWAIGGLVNAKVKHMQHHHCKVVPVHPRDAKEKANSFLAIVDDFNPDIIVYEYFRTAEQLINTCPKLKGYKSILVHHNQRDKALFHADWNQLGINTIVTHTNKCREKLEEKGYRDVVTINHGIDFDFFKYKEKDPEIPIIGYVGRIVPWKGLKEIAEVADELGYKVQVMGKMDKADYWDEIPKECLNFEYFNCKNEDRVEAYHNMTIYVGNSEDNYEEGTLPFLEAMACGVSVVTTLNGVANDIVVDEENALVVPFKDKKVLKEQIKRLMEDGELRKKLKRNAWNTVKNMPEEKMAYEYSKLFNKVKYGTDKLVSVIIPSTFSREEQVVEILHALSAQSYSAIEAIVVWDEDSHTEEDLVRVHQYRKDLPITVKYIFTDAKGYNLARARNLGAIEAEGEFLMFNDSRMKPDVDAVQTFVYAMNSIEGDSFWMFGDKGANKNSFVENFSFVKRSGFMRFGMMCERIDRYGGMSQEIRTRWIMQNGQLSYLPDAKATQLISSSTDDVKRRNIVDMKLKLLKMYNGISH